MWTWWSAPAAAGLLVLAACGGQGPDASRPTTAPPASSTTAGPRPTPSSPMPSSPPAHPTSLAPTTPRPSAHPTTKPALTPTAPKPTSTPHPPRTPALPAVLRGRVLTTVPTSQKVVALTFDGGAGSQGAASILTTLRSHNVPASFFVTGRFAQTNPGTTSQMAALGPVGNHSRSHPDFTNLSETTLTSELSTARAAILAATGKDPRPFFRFPFGAYDTRALGLVNARGYGAIGWTTDSLGWKGTSGGMSTDAVVSRVLAGRTPGQIVLLHVGANPDDGTTLDAAALPRIIAGYRANGYAFVTLDVLR